MWRLCKIFVMVSSIATGPVILFGKWTWDQIYRIEWSEESVLGYGGWLDGACRLLRCYVDDDGYECVSDSLRYGTGECSGLSKGHRRMLWDAIKPSLLMLGERLEDEPAYNKILSSECQHLLRIDKGLPWMVYFTIILLIGVSCLCCIGIRQGMLMMGCLKE